MRRQRVDGGALFRYANADSLDMPWLPLSRFESQASRDVWSGSEGQGVTPNIR
jgi:hypothetical protein